MSKGAFKLYRAERDKGLTYQEIADKYGVSKSNVQKACAEFNPSYFKFHKEKTIIYPTLRKWMNDKKISISELVRRLGYECCARTRCSIARVLSGVGNPRKELIDKLIAVTGMTYEELFKV